MATIGPIQIERMRRDPGLSATITFSDYPNDPLDVPIFDFIDNLSQSLVAAIAHPNVAQKMYVPEYNLWYTFTYDGAEALRMHSSSGAELLALKPWAWTRQIVRLCQELAGDDASNMF